MPPCAPAWSRASRSATPPSTSASPRRPSPSPSTTPRSAWSSPTTCPVARDPAVQRHVGELSAHLDAALLVLADSAARWEPADVVDRGVLANRAKLLATEVGLEVTSKVIQLVGGRGAYKDYLAERAFRDVRTSTLMPPTMDKMLEGIGKGALGLDAVMFNVPGEGP